MDHLSPATRFPPSIFASQSISPAMSPKRHTRFDDALAHELSPSTVIQAFRNGSFATELGEHSLLSSLSTASASERDLGSRVARAAELLRAWNTEFAQWDWSGSFQGRTGPSSDSKDLGEVREETPEEAEFWGSLPANQVQRYGQRLEEISRELALLDMEELKEHILSIHGGGRSRPSSSYSTTSSNLSRLDDFSIVITHVLLRSLPQLTRLRHLMQIWTARLTVSHEVPYFLHELARTTRAIELAWKNLEPPRDGEANEMAMGQWQDAINTIEEVLQRSMADLGQRLDRMLDLLEGHDDRLPDAWIDDFEKLEAEYGQWVSESRYFLVEVAMLLNDSRHVKNGKNTASDLSSSFSGRQSVQEKSAVLAEPAKPVFKTYSDPSNKRGAVSTLPPIRDPQLGRPVSTKPLLKSIVDGADEYQDHPGYLGKTSTQIADSSTAVKHSSSPSKVESSFGLGIHTTTIGGTDGEAWSDLAQTQGGRSGLVDELEDTLHKGGSVLPADRISSIQISDTTNQSSVEDPVAQPSNTPLSSPSLLPTTSQVQDDGANIVSASILDSEQPSHSSTQIHYAGSVDSGIDRDVNSLRHDDVASQSIPQTPDRKSRSDSLSSPTSIQSTPSSPFNVINDSPSVRAATNRPGIKLGRPPLNAAMTKRRAKVDSSAPSTPSWPPSQFSHLLTDDQAERFTPRKKETKPSPEDLEKQISNILTTIPAHIRLAKGPRLNSPDPGSARSASSGRPSLRTSRSFMKSPELVLSPVRADESSARKTAVRDSDVKVYHLTQPGKDQPIKLFVRRVGENGERVMVRVGGGWADLGDYLRQYAEHHGRRTTSEGKFEVLGDTITPRLNSSLNGKRVSSGNIPTRSLSRIEVPTEESLVVTPTRETPVETPNSALSTGSSKHSWKGDEVGLAGPSSKKTELTGDKREWVEGMMNKAKRISSLGSPKPDFGDLGKIGGTKRVFLKGSGITDQTF